MTQKDKELLLKDLCARLPYGVKIMFSSNGFRWDWEQNLDEIRQCEDGEYAINGWGIHGIKPYLRPLSSMTEEEKKDILQLLNIHGDIDNEGNLLLGVECNIVTLKVCKKYLGELNKRMFDICHMIEKGLALEAPEGMYEIQD